VIQPNAVTPQTGFQIPKARSAAQLGIQQRHELAFRGQSPHASIRFVARHQISEPIPRNVLQERVKNAILVMHGVIPFSVSDHLPVSETE
jgi:hypothetical protein